MNYRNLASIALLALNVGCLYPKLPPTYNILFSPAKVSKCPTTNLQIPGNNIQTIIAEFEVSKTIGIPDGTATVTIDYLICAYDLISEIQRIREGHNFLKVYAINDLKSGNTNPSIIIRREVVGGKEGAYFTIEEKGNPIDEGKPTLTFYQNLPKPGSFSQMIQDFLEILTEKRAKRDSLLPPPGTVSEKIDEMKI